MGAEKAQCVCHRLLVSPDSSYRVLEAQMTQEGKGEPVKSMLPNPATKQRGRVFLTFVPVSRNKAPLVPAWSQVTPQQAVLWAAPVGSELIYCSQVDGHMPCSTHPDCSFGCRLDGSAPAPCSAVPSCPSCTRLLADFPIVWGSGARHSSPAAHVGGQVPFAPEGTSSSISWREEPDGRRENEQFVYNSS